MKAAFARLASPSTGVDDRADAAAVVLAAGEDLPDVVQVNIPAKVNDPRLGDLREKTFQVISSVWMDGSGMGGGGHWERGHYPVYASDSLDEVRAWMAANPAPHFCDREVRVNMKAKP